MVELRAATRGAFPHRPTFTAQGRAQTPTSAGRIRVAGRPRKPVYTGRIGVCRMNPPSGCHTIVNFSEIPHCVTEA